ncbi:helix loop helix protein 3B isoform X3 [Ptiloglossa arizonensis]|uniref:helix loop helix protein 3B isoform X3 n=1 Tax=Ptiloglossa arizonensis TaxID=3350558 RepID=UPI003FA00B52
MRRVIVGLQSMLAYNGCGAVTVDTENGSPAESLLSAEGELAEDVGDSPGTPRDTEEEATLSDEFYSHDTDDEEDQGKKRRDRANSTAFRLPAVATLALPHHELELWVFENYLQTAVNAGDNKTSVVPSPSSENWYIRLLSNVLEWQKAQDRNDVTQHEVRIKCEPAFNAQNSTAYPTKPVMTFLKQEKQVNDNHNPYRTSFSTQKQLQHSVSHVACDKNGNNLLMIAPAGHNVSGTVNKRSATPSTIAVQNTFPPGALSNGSLIRSTAGPRASTYPKSPQITVQSVTSANILTNCSSNTPLNNNVSPVNGGVSTCGQKRLKIEREDEEQSGQGKDCKPLSSHTHSAPPRKRVKVAFTRDTNSGFRNDFRSNVDRK